MKTTMIPQNEVIQKLIDETGYAAVNADGRYYHTVGMGLKGKPDLFALPHIPFELFQCVVQDYFNGNLLPETIGSIPEFKIPGFGLEPAMVKLTSLNLDAAVTMRTYLAIPLQSYRFVGMLLVLGPDANNWHANHPQSVIQYDPDRAVGDIFTDIWTEKREKVRKHWEENEKDS